MHSKRQLKINTRCQVFARRSVSLYCSHSHRSRDSPIGGELVFRFPACVWPLYNLKFSFSTKTHQFYYIAFLGKIKEWEILKQNSLFWILNIDLISINKSSFMSKQILFQVNYSRFYGFSQIQPRLVITLNERYIYFNIFLLLG